MEGRVRIGALLFVVVLTGALCVAYGSAQLWDHPSGGTVGEDPTPHDGEQVMWFGHVSSTDAAGDTALVSVDDVEYTVTGLSAEQLDRFEEGADIQVAGTLAEDGTTLEADELVVDHGNASDRYYVYGTSIVGGLFAAGLFLRHWRIDWRRWRFLPRGES